VLDYEELIAGAIPVPDARRGGDSLLGIFTAAVPPVCPKGVMLSHDNRAQKARN
jgi:hypothetical protein